MMAPPSAHLLKPEAWKSLCTVTKFCRCLLFQSLPLCPHHQVLDVQALTLPVLLLHFSYQTPTSSYSPLLTAVRMTFQITSVLFSCLKSSITLTGSSPHWLIPNHPGHMRNPANLPITIKFLISIYYITIPYFLKYFPIARHLHYLHFYL